MSEDGLTAAFLQQFFNFLGYRNVTPPINPIKAAKVLNKVTK